jgi:hypothetical protein
MKHLAPEGKERSKPIASLYGSPPKRFVQSLQRKGLRAAEENFPLFFRILQRVTRGVTLIAILRA